MKRICFYALRELHVPILLRVYHAMKKLPGSSEWEVGFCAPDFLEGTPKWPEEGLNHATIQELTSQGIPFWANQHTPKYDAVITADVCYDRVDNWGPVVCVGHGTISKNIFFVDQPICRRENYADILCVPGPWYSQCFGSMVHTHIAPTGFPKLDALIEDHSDYISQVLQSDVSKLKQTVALYAPTYNPEMCSLEIMEVPLRQLAEKNMTVLIKLHGATQQQIRDRYIQLAETHPNIIYLYDHDVIPWMQVSDFLISDVSSVYVEYLLLDKPIFLFNHPKLFECEFYNPKAVEFQSRDACYQFTDAWSFLPLIEKKLQDDHLKSKRVEFAKVLFPKLDGKNSHRVALEVQKLVDSPRSFPSYREEYIYVILEPENGFSKEKILIIQDNLSHLAFSKSPLICWISSKNSIPSKEFNFCENLSISEVQAMHIDQVAGVILLNGELHLPREFDKIIAMHHKIWQPLAQVQFPLLENSDKSFYQRQISVLPQRLEGDSPTKTQLYFKHVYFAESANVRAAIWDGTFLQLGLFSMWLDFYLSPKDEKTKQFDWFYFHLNLHEQKINTVCNLGLYGYF